MNIKYKLLNNDTAVIMTRKPQLVYDDITFSFDGVAENSTAIFVCSGVSYYRQVKKGKCVLPLKKLCGVIQLTIAKNDGVFTGKWVCEPINAEPQKNGGVLISPNDMNIPEEIINLKIENQHIREENAFIKAELLKFNKRLEEIMEAYDFT